MAATVHTTALTHRIQAKRTDTKLGDDAAGDVLSGYTSSKIRCSASQRDLYQLNLGHLVTLGKQTLICFIWSNAKWCIVVKRKENNAYI